MTTWIIPCNAGFYDICGSFLHFKRINWRQSRSICQGDTIYIYVGVPIKAILYKCIATKVNLEEKEIDDRKFIKKDATLANKGQYMELELIDTFPPDALTFVVLAEHGLQGSIQGPRRPNEQLLDLLQSFSTPH